jgi:hypothetical protein
MDLLGGRYSAGIQPCCVVGAQDADPGIGEGEVDQRFVPDCLAPLLSGPRVPQWLRDAADRAAWMGAGEGVD